MISLGRSIDATKIMHTPFQGIGYILSDKRAIKSESFLARDSMLSALYAISRPSVCLSVRLYSVRQTGGSYKKRLKLGLWNFHYTVAPSI